MRGGRGGDRALSSSCLNDSTTSITNGRLPVTGFRGGRAESEGLGGDCLSSFGLVFTAGDGSVLFATMPGKALRTLDSAFCLGALGVVRIDIGLEVSARPGSACRPTMPDGLDGCSLFPVRKGGDTTFTPMMVFSCVHLSTTLLVALLVSTRSDFSVRS